MRVGKIGTRGKKVDTSILNHKFHGIFVVCFFTAFMKDSRHTGNVLELEAQSHI